MRNPRGIALVLGIGIALVILVAAIAGAMYYGARTSTVSPTNGNANTSVDSAVKLACTQASDCAAYCGLESTYTPYCDSTKHCTCSYTGEPVPSGNTNTAITDFSSCAAAGNPVQESYPRKCSVGGRTFTEVLANSNVNAAKNTNQSTNANVSTAGWKTYTNTTFKFNVKYPTDWNLTEATLANSQAMAITLAKGNNYKIIFLPKGEFDHGFPEVKSREKATLGGQNVTKTIFKDSTSYFLYTFESYSQNGWTSDNRIELTTSDIELTNRILSTFTFLDETAGWKTYTNSTAKYSFKYPSDWQVEGDGLVKYNISKTDKFGSPFVRVVAKENLYPNDACLLSTKEVRINGVKYTQQEEGCAYAGNTVATFFPSGNGYLAVTWTTDWEDYFSLYETILSTFTK